MAELDSLPGPSPLARGKHGNRGQHEMTSGTIPARAGETWRGWASASGTRDHPRSRGGNEDMGEISHIVHGPSPLARGKPIAPLQIDASEGTIPARAGETGTPRMRSARCTDHPRSRGGNAGLTRSRRSRKGPSPLARGKPLAASNLSFTSGTIPARAGETSTHAALVLAIGDHPRSRGGNSTDCL